ncbi:7TM diverse intracellular signaling domain-containing protein [Oligoflexus tunisiensis]|uniref:7TM diverse intracellular signaling domain-containing protein n=1 Tax=Oligoflexus tunisiensis TaxID=708132 RepID=UPI000A7E93EC|nr:7TM diverse intracellular signaling domain-containing protein [Oligoflexus tunisiensis]
MLKLSHAILFSLLLAFMENGQGQTLHEGELDLRSWNFDEKPLLPLRGSWEFYWSQLLTPEDFQEETPEGREWIRVPGSWSLVTPHPTYGVATYRLRVHLSEPRALALHAPWILSAAKVFIDGVQVESLGHITRQREPGSGQSYVREDFWVFHPLKSTFDIVIQVANHESMMAGLPHAPKLGSARAIKTAYQREIAIALALMGSILLMGIYHLCLFALRTKVRSTLYFAGVCVSVAFYIFGAEGTVVATFLPEVEYPTRLRLILSWMPACPLFLYFAHELFPGYFSKRFIHAYALITLVLFSYFWLTDITDIAYKFYAYQLLTAGIMLHGIIALIRAVRRGEDGAWIFVAGLCVVVVTGVNDLLRAVIDSPPLAGFGLLTFIVCQSFLLARRFSQAFRDLARSEQQVRQLNENLEVLVEEKTRDIRSIMDHIQLGIFAITAPGRTIHKDHSRHLQTLFKQEDLTGQDAGKLLFQDSQLSSDEQHQACQALEAMLGEQGLSFDMNSEALPKETHYTEVQGNTRILELTWHPVINSQDIVEKILVTARDVTQLRALQEDAHDREEELQFIQELLNISPEAFHRFIQTCEEFLEENRRLINSRCIALRDMEALKLLFINMHTMKGAARSLYLKKITRIFHDVEQYYAVLQKEPEIHWDIERMNQDLDEAHHVLETYESINRNKLGRRMNEDGHVDVSAPDLVRVYRQLQDLEADLDSKAQARIQDIQRFLLPLVFRPLQSMLEETALCTEALARDLHKAPPVVLIEAHGYNMEERTDHLLRRVLIHILRNTMDHGIELPAVRLNAGKPESGLIQIRVSRNTAQVLLHYQDDGQGLDLIRLRTAAEQQGMIMPGAILSPQESAELMFCSGLSTSSTVTDISGRGVGMDAVKKYLEAAGGEIRVELREPVPGQSGRPFSFTIALPRSLFVFPSKETDVAAA